jgi:hypothetical protein
MPTQKISPIAELFKDWNIDWSDLIGLVGVIAALLGPFLAWYLNRIGRANIQMLKLHEIQSVEIQKSQANIIYDNQVKSDISKFILPSHEDTLAGIRQLAEAVGVEEFEFGDLQILFSPFSTGDTAIGIHDITVLLSISLINAGNRPATVTAIEAEIDDSDREAAQLSHGTIYVNTIFATERAALPLLVRRQLPCPVVLPHLIIKLLEVLPYLIRYSFNFSTIPRFKSHPARTIMSGTW